MRPASQNVPSRSAAEDSHAQLLRDRDGDAEALAPNAATSWPHPDRGITHWPMRMPLHTGGRGGDEMWQPTSSRVVSRWPNCGVKESVRSLK